MQSFIYKKKFWRRVERFIVFAFVFLVPFTQVVSYPVAYAVNYEKNVVTKMREAAKEAINTPVAAAKTANAETFPLEEGEFNYVSNDIKEQHDLVAIVVDRAIYDDSSSYVGLRDEVNSNKLNRDTIRERILDYAEDVAENNELTDSKILFYRSDEDSVVDVAKALENLYLNGDGSGKNKLAGVVLIGNVPIPVVNKNGNRFISMYPYTDFVDKAYIYNPVTDSFERNSSAINPQVEIWHGVIRVEGNTTNDKEKLASFFDKNHLYYEGDPRFAEFDKRMFYGDLIREQENLNPDMYKSYLKYLESMEDLAYMRYNKHWANELMQTMGASALDEIGSDSAPTTEGGEAFLEQVDKMGEGGASATGLPDIYSKMVIDRMLPAYLLTVKKYISTMNDYVESTGRYMHIVQDAETEKKTKELDVDSTPALVTMKDEYAKVYLKTVNDALEQQVNKVAQKIQEPIDILQKSVLTGSKAMTGLTAPYKVTSDKVNQDGTSTEVDSNTVINFHYFNEVEDKLYVNGIEARKIQSPKLCSVYLGSTKDIYFDSNESFNPKRLLVNGVYSILTRSMRFNNLSTASPQHTIGVNTRLLDPKEAKKRTLNKATHGALIEDNVDYGTPAFLSNFLQSKADKYKNPFDGDLKKGDVITEVSFGMPGLSLGSLLINNEMPLESAVENAYLKIFNLTDKDEQMNTPGKNHVVGEIKITFYRSSIKLFTKKTFTVGDNGLTSKDIGGSTSDGAIFTLNSTRYFDAGDDPRFSGSGYFDNGYDNAAGCNAAIGVDDQCFSWVANMPILDPAGSVSLVKFNDSLRFPDAALGTLDRKKTFQYPEGYKLEDVDEVIMNSCFAGVPGITAEDDATLEYDFPLDTDSKHASDNFVYFKGGGTLFSKLIYNVGHYFFRGNGEPADIFPKEDFASTAGTVICGEENDEGGCVPSESDNWLGLDRLDASKVLLSDREGTGVITLKYFTDRYGLFDGIDNNKNNITDEDAEEFLNSISNKDIDEIYRKMLSHDATFVTPDGQRLQVKTLPYKQNVSSVILHNEPTYYTISQQIKSGATNSLPIDNPRYVAFQSKVSHKTKTNGSDYYVPGEIQKVVYPNLFKENNLIQVKADLSALAAKIALIPGSYKIFGTDAEPGDYSLKEIKDEIFNNYLLPVVSSDEDVPMADAISDESLSVASEAKIKDALEWMNLSIDDKHEYILKTYLNPKIDAYVGDKTVLNDNGESDGGGYEAAYLVFDGKAGAFDTGFNKDTEETDPLFDPLSEEYQETFDDSKITEGGDDDDDGGDDLPWIWDWIPEELMPFLEDLQNIGEFENACVFSEEAGGGDGNGSGSGGGDEAEKELAGIKLSVDKTKFQANGSEKIIVTVQGLDANGESIGKWGNKTLIKLKINQNSSAPIVKNLGLSENTLVDGVVTFTLMSTKNIGNAVIMASGGGFNSENINLVSGGAYLNMISYSYSEISGMEEFLKSSQGGSEEAKAESGDDDDTTSSSGETKKDSTVNTEAKSASDQSTNSESSDTTGGTGTDESKASADDDDDITISGDKNDTSETTTDGNKNTNDSGASSDSEGGSSSGSEDSSSTSSSSADSETGGDKEIIILESTPVTPPTETPEIVEPTQTWQNYYFLNEYFKKFLPDLESTNIKDRKLVAEILSDTLLAYIPDKVNPFVDAENNTNSKYMIEENDQVVADGVSIMKVAVQIFDAENKLDMASHKIKFSIISDIPNIVAFENKGGNIVDSVNGVATVYLRAGTKTGSFKLHAEGVDLPYPPIEKELYLVAGEANSIVLTPESNLLVANGESKTNLVITLKDQFGNTANNSVYKLAVFADDKVFNLADVDENDKFPGTQISTVDGKATIEVLSKDVIGKSNIYVLVQDDKLEELFASGDLDSIESMDLKEYAAGVTTMTVVSGVELKLNVFYPASQNSLKANGKQIVKIKPELLYNGNVVAGYNGPIKIELLNENLLNFVADPPAKMNGGILHEANTQLKSGTLAGEAEIKFEIPGFASESAKIKVSPLAPRYIEVSTSEDTVQTHGQNPVTLEAKIYDKNGNLVDTDSSTAVTFQPTTDSQGMIAFSSAQTAIALKGIASTRIKGGNKSGEANIKAFVQGKSNDEIRLGTISIKVQKHITADDVKGFEPRALYVSLLGGDFGNFVKNNLASAVLFNGQVQAVSTVTAIPEDSKKIIMINPTGVVEILGDGIESKSSTATGNFPYQKIILSDSIEAKELAEVFLVPKTNAELALLKEDEAIPEAENIYVQKISKQAAITAEKVTGAVQFKEDGEIKASVDKYGRVKILDDRYKVRLATPDDGYSLNSFALILCTDEEDTGLIVYKQNFAKNVNKIPYGTFLTAFQPGIYVKNLDSTERFLLKESFSGTSSNDFKGAVLLDTANPLDTKMAPGFSPGSLEAAKKSDGLGFNQNNKHILLFAAGNNVGESNIPSASEVGIVYGDPLVHVEKEDFADDTQDPEEQVNNVISDANGFTKDLGKMVFSGKEKITSLTKFDYNGDDYDDFLLGYEDGRIRLLENIENTKRLNDQGEIIKVAGGILSMTRIDVNGDNLDDLIIGTNEPCLNGEQCITQLINANGDFRRSTLNLMLEGKVLKMKAADVNDDECEDLVATDSAGNIRIFYNREGSGNACLGLNSAYGYTKNFGFALDNGADLSSNLFVNYGGMEQINDSLDEDLSNAYKFIKLVLSSDTMPPADPNEIGGNFSSTKYKQQGDQVLNLVQNKPDIAEKILPEKTYSKEYSFINLKYDPKLSVASKKTANDDNGSPLKLNDKITYTLTLKNNGSSNINNLMVSDAMPTTMKLLEDSLICADSNCPDTPVWEKTGVSFRPQVIKGISIPAGGTRTIKYSMEVLDMPMVDFELGTKLTEYPSNNGDPYTDILIRPKVNPKKVLTYIYSTGLGTDNKVTYSTFEKTSSGDKLSLVKKQSEDLGLPDIEDLLDSIPESPFGEDGPTQSQINSMSQDDWEAIAADTKKPNQAVQDSMTSVYNSTNEDANYDGCPDSWGSTSVSSQGTNFSATVEVGGAQAAAVADAIEDMTNLLRCSGAGCLPIPYNYAFLVPMFWLPGVTMFSILNNLPIFLPFDSSYDPFSVFRFYLSPTLTAGLGTAMCFGTPILFPPTPVYPGGPINPCLAFAVPLQAMGVCPDFAGMIEDAVANAQDYVNDELSDTGMLGSSDEDLPAGTDGDTFNFFPADSPVQAAASLNVKIPGFPSVITDWIDNQTDEIFNKLLDFPDIYLILPDFYSGLIKPSVDKLKDFENPFRNVTGNSGAWGKSSGAVKGTIQGFNDFINYVGSFPFLSIEPKEVTVKIPAISRTEIYKYKYQWEETKNSWKDEWERWKEYWSCQDADNPNKTICDNVNVNMTELISSIDKFMSDLDELLNLPRKILTWKYIEAKYAEQVICYMDAVIKLIGGWVKKQTKIILHWIAMIEEVLRMILEWAIIIDLVIEFKTNCDECKNHRFSTINLLLSLLMVLPSPPIIPLPKWPDLVIDFSQIKTGITVVWPDVKFVPEPIFLPDLPVLNLPVWTPGLNFKIPGFFVEFPKFELPELPNLPPLPMPKLPDLPEPFKIPPLPDLVFQLAINLKAIFKIICLLFKALMPIPESALETEIETLTQPNLNIVLAILAKLAIKLPPITYDFVREVRVTGKLDATVDTNFVYATVKNFVEQNWNANVKKIVLLINEYTTVDLQAIVDEVVKAFVEAIRKAIEDTLGVCIKFEGEGADSEEQLQLCAKQAKEECKKAAGTYDVGGETADKICEEQNKASLKSKYSSAYSVLYPNESPADTTGATENITIPNYDDFYGEGATVDPDNINNLTDPQLNEIEELMKKKEALLNVPPFSLLSENVKDMGEKIAKFAEDMDAIDVPEKYYLTVDQTFIDSSHPLLNKSIAEIENGIKNEDIPDLPALKKMAAVRDSMIAYTKDLENTNKLLESINDYDKFNKILVQNDENEVSEKVASLNLTQSSSEKINLIKQDLFGPDMEKDLKQVLNEKRLLASTDQIEEYQNSVNDATSVPAPKGIFAVKDGKAENVVNYTKELGDGLILAFSDVDQDDDSDLIYTFGTDVYLKENYLEDDEFDNGDVLSSADISDYVETSMNTVEGVGASYIGNRKADISWLSNGIFDAYGYEIVLRKSLNDDIEDSAYRFIALNDKFASERSKLLLDALGEDTETMAAHVFELSNPEKPVISVEIENGNYYATVFALDSDGNRSLNSQHAVINPSLCADKDAPTPVVTPSELKVSVMKDISIDASKSFDAQSNIISYYLETVPFTNGDKKVSVVPAALWSDLDNSVDSDGDGNKTNDRNNPVFRIGPFTEEGDVGTHKFILHVVDEAKNSSAQEINVEVFVPKIDLDERLSIAIPEALGKTDEAQSNLPFALMKKFYLYRVIDEKLTLIPQVKKIITSAIGDKNKYYTAEDGSYSVNDFTLKDFIQVKNSGDKIVAEINSITGNVCINDDTYSVMANKATGPNDPTSIDVFKKNGPVLSTHYLISDPNIDVTVNKEIEDYLSLTGGVYVNDLEEDDNFIFESLPGDNQIYPGGAVLKDTEKKTGIAAIDSSGNILLFDKNLNLAIAKNDCKKDPLLVLIRYGKEIIGQVYVSVAYADRNAVIAGPNDVPFATPRKPYDISFYTPSYGDAPLANKLFAQGLIDGTVTENGLDFGLGEFVKRGEFVKSLLGMICVVPKKPEAYDPWVQGQGFSDVPYSEPLDAEYPYIKQAALLNLIDGYQGETDENGLHPFKPDNTINLAEATKIILDGLQFKGVVDLSTLPEAAQGQPWYLPYINAAQDLTPYLKEGVSLTNNFIITAEEAKNPGKQMNNEELISMIDSVIQIYDCSDDLTYCQEKYGITDLAADNDDDGLSNNEECSYGTSPLDPDTDKGGVKDGEEFKVGTNMLYPIDDPIDSDKDGLSDSAETLVFGTDPLDPDTDDGGVNDGEEVITNLTDPLDKADDKEPNEIKEGFSGIYVVPANCNTCPCTATLQHKADLVPGDSIFSVISNFSEDFIFAKSNEVLIK